MVRRLIDQNARREQIRQSRMLDRMELPFRRRLQAEIARAMAEMVRVWELTGEVPPERDHLERIAAIYQGMAETAVRAFAARVVSQGKSWDRIERKDFADTMAAMALRYIAQEAIRRRIVQVAETTRSQIVSAVARGYADGLGQSGVANYIRELIPTMSGARAGVIARTETHGAANFGATEAARETGLRLRREWISADDERTRQAHADANGQIVGQDEPFIVDGEALMYPGDPDGRPENVINCRCSVGFVVDD